MIITTGAGSGNDGNDPIDQGPHSDKNNMEHRSGDSGERATPP